MLISLVLLVAGMMLLLGGGDALVRGASGLALRLGVSPLVIGLTVVAFGTSAPELAVNIMAALQGRGEVSFGNIIGSNLANIGLILGLTALWRPLAIHATVLKRELPMMNLATVVVLVMALDGPLRQGVGEFDRSEGIILLLLFCVFLFYTARDAFRQNQGETLFQEFGELQSAASRSWWLDVLLTLGGLAALTGGGQVTVGAAVSIATALAVPEVIIGLTILAIGTSLPELATSLMAAYRGQMDLAVGNVVGSNIFNLLLVMGVTAGVASVPVPVGGITDLVVLVLISLLLLPSAATGRVITRGEGAFYLGVYIAYTVWRSMGAM